MKKKHYKKELSAFSNQELSPGARQTVGEHLLHCPDCRAAHDEIKFAAALARQLPRGAAPDRVWPRIEAGLVGKTALPAPTASFLKPAYAACAAALLIAVFGFAIVYYNFVSGGGSTDKAAAWQVENIAGAPRILNSTDNEMLQIGAMLETDAGSSARIEVADIGQIEVAPNSLIKLVNSSQTEHRLALEYGSLEAKIFAPPRLFVVDTPTAAAVDLGCAYKLDVDRFGNSTLHVKSGYVALERDGRESIVPAGAYCLTKRGKGLGTPYLETATAEFKDALRQFDFENGGTIALEKILAAARPADTLTLWHLLGRVAGTDRERVFEKTVSFTKLPAGTTREGILALDREMLDEWRYQLELSWYE